MCHPPPCTQSCAKSSCPLKPIQSPLPFMVISKLLICSSTPNASYQGRFDFHTFQ